MYKGVVDAYSRLFGSTIKTEVLHAGLECGHIAAKYPSLEIVSIGPTLENVHTTNERLKVASLVKMWDLLQEVLQAPAVSGRSLQEIFGSPDDLKFRSSMTLFASASDGEPLFSQALHRYCGGVRDPATLELLGLSPKAPASGGL